MTSLEDIFGIKITDKTLFKRALTHPSFTMDNNLNVTECYERLEFLGDAVLKLVVSDDLYKKFPNYQEGELTKIRSIIVSDSTLSKIAEKIGLDELLILGKNQEKIGGRKIQSIQACAFEAVLGAYFLDGKEKEISKFLREIFEPYIKDIDEHFEKYNAKAYLQEFIQAKSKSLPEYKILEQKGPNHDCTFVVEVVFDGKVLAKGEGKTKKEAEQQAAYKACQSLDVF